MPGVTLEDLAKQRDALKPRRSRRSRKKTLRGVTPQKAVSARYFAQLSYLIGLMHQSTMWTLTPVLEQWLAPGGFVRDDRADDIKAAMEALREELGGLNPIIEEVAASFTASVDRVQRRKFFGAIKRAVGVNVEGIISNEGIAEAVADATQQNVSLIKTLPERYFAQIESMTYNQIIAGDLDDGLPFTDQIEALYGEAEKHARTNAQRIARDQNNKLSGKLSEIRQTNAGIEEYVWSDSGDGAVRKSHRGNNGKTYRWDSPPKKTGHPGHDINCRCTALPVLKIPGIAKRRVSPIPRAA